MSTTTTPSSTTADYPDLPSERPLHTHELLQLLDTPLRRAIERGDAIDATAIAYCARLRGAHRYSILAAALLVPSCAALGDRLLVDAVLLGVSRAQQHAEDAIEVEIRAAAIKRAQHAGAQWTLRLYARPLVPTATTPKETSYACTILDADGRPTGELRALVDALGEPAVLDLDRELDRVFVLRDRLVGRRARAITADDQSRTTHLLRVDGY